MKRILGSFFILCMMIYAKDEFASYTIQANKTDVVVNEAVYAIFETRQQKHDEVMFFDLIPLKSDAYEVVLIEKKRFEYDYHDAKKTYHYLIFPKKEGDVKVEFSFSIRRASDEAVAQTYVGSRDNVKYIPTLKTQIAQPSITLHVKQLPQNIDAVGEFHLSSQIDTTTSDPYSRVNVIYTLQGKGYLDPQYEPLKDIKGVALFKGVKEGYKKPTQEGYVYQKEFSYALVAENNFTIPSVKLDFYDTTQKKIKTLTTKQYSITIVKPSIEHLVDTKEYPQKEQALLVKIVTEYIYYIVVFFVGFFTREIYERYIHKRFQKKYTKKKNTLEAIKTPQQLLGYLLSIRENYSVDEEIKKLEAIVYNGEKKYNFAIIKSQIVKKLN